MKREYGLQMYSVRDLAEQDFGKALSEVGKLGYQTVETAGFYNLTAEEVLEKLKAAKVKLSGTHSSWENLRAEEIDQTIAFHKEIGNPDYIIPAAKLNSLSLINEFVEVVNAAQPKLEKAGIQLGFHNHSTEFQMMYWGSPIHTELEKRTGLHFEIDTFWAYNAGIDPIATCERLGDRVHVIHLKDGFAGGRGMALGEGTAPISQVLAMAHQKGYRVVVESETLQPTGIEEVGRCMNWLKANG